MASRYTLLLHWLLTLEDDQETSSIRTTLVNGVATHGSRVVWTWYGSTMNQTRLLLASNDDMTLEMRTFVAVKTGSGIWHMQFGHATWAFACLGKCRNLVITIDQGQTRRSTSC
jgi:hypothetical protein